MQYFDNGVALCLADYDQASIFQVSDNSVKK